MRQLVTHALLALSAVAAIGCAGEAGADWMGSPDAGGLSDSSTCGTAISFDPIDPMADAVAPIRAAVNVVGAPGVFTYTWSVTRGGTTINFTFAQSDESQIDFVAPVAGAYRVTVSIDGPVAGCNYADAFLNVTAPGANVDNYRLRAVPSASVAPPQETIIAVSGGGDVQRSITLDPGLMATGTVRSGTSSGPGVAAYLKFMPSSAPNAIVETFTPSGGTFNARLLGQNHNVLVIPTATTLAPKLVAWTPSTTTLVVTGGTVVTGTVLGPSGSGASGVKVQLMAGGVPSTVATTLADGSFSLRTDFPASTPITVKVTPSPASGLPRLEATSANFVLGSPMQITYSASLTTCNLLNTPVRRSTVNQPNAKVTVVGALGTAGTVMTGSASASAQGTVRIAATADGSGRLPSMLVPESTALSAVTELGTSDFAVSALDTSTCNVTAVDAPPQITATGTAKDGSNVMLGGVRIEATPVGALALADAQVVATTTGTTGSFSLALASGGRYDVRFIDPAARVAPLELMNILPAGVPTSAVLPKALAIKGKVTVANSSQPLTNTSIQILCAQCSGVEATRPISETATDSVSEYRIAVPDPGTM